MKVEKGVKVFTLPGEEHLLNEIMNDEFTDIMNKIVTPCPKEGVILYLIEYEKTKR